MTEWTRVNGSEHIMGSSAVSRLHTCREFIITPSQTHDRTSVFGAERRGKPSSLPLSRHPDQGLALQVIGNARQIGGGQHALRKGTPRRALRFG